MYIKNQYGKEIDYDAAVMLMDDELREELVVEGVYQEGEEFFNAYAQAHLERFGQEFEPAKRNPVW